MPHISLTEKAAADKAPAISTSSASLHFSLKVFFHSSTKGPLEVSLVRTPTFFYCHKTRLASARVSLVKAKSMTYAGGIDGFGNLSQLLLIGSSIFASD